MPMCERCWREISNDHGVGLCDDCGRELAAEDVIRWPPRQRPQPA